MPRERSSRREAGGEGLIRVLAEAAPMGAAVLDPRLRYRWLNPALAEMNGRSADDHIGRRPREVLGEMGESLEELLEEVMAQDTAVVNRQFLGQRPGNVDHGSRWMGSYYPLHDSAGQVIGVGALVNDVTEQERASLRERDFLAALVRVSHAVASEMTTAEVFSIVAEEAARTLELDGAVVARFEARGICLLGRWGAVRGPAKTLGVLLPAASTPLTELVRHTGRTQRAVADEPDALGFVSRVAAPIRVGDRLWGAVKAGSRSRVGLSDDAEERMARFADLVGLAVANAAEHRRLLAAATRDPLTGLPNRHSFDTRLEAEVERARRHTGSFSLAIIDIDHFKDVNDTYGHAAGDRVLVDLARRLEREARAEDLVARIGGEEFAWVMPVIDAGQAVHAAERVRRGIADMDLGRARHITVSVGVCDFGEAEDGATLFELADRALYHAKEQGRDRCAVWIGQEAQVVSRRGLRRGSPSESSSGSGSSSASTDRFGSR